jgi:hypothetical protein
MAQAQPGGHVLADRAEAGPDALAAFTMIETKTRPSTSFVGVSKRHYGEARRKLRPGRAERWPESRPARERNSGETPLVRLFEKEPEMLRLKTRLWGLVGQFNNAV